MKDLCDMFDFNHLINPNLGEERGGDNLTRCWFFTLIFQKR